MRASRWIRSAVRLACLILSTGCTDRAGQPGVPAGAAQPPLATENTSAAVTLEWVDVHSGGYHLEARWRLSNGSGRPITLQGLTERFPNIRLTWQKDGEWTDPDMSAKADPARRRLRESQLVMFTLNPGSHLEFGVPLLGPTNMPMKVGTAYWLESSSAVPNPTSWPTVWSDARVPDEL